MVNQLPPLEFFSALIINEFQIVNDNNSIQSEFLNQLTQARKGNQPRLIAKILGEVGDYFLYAPYAGLQRAVRMFLTGIECLKLDENEKILALLLKNTNPHSKKFLSHDSGLTFGSGLVGTVHRLNSSEWSEKDMFLNVRLLNRAGIGLAIEYQVNLAASYYSHALEILDRSTNIENTNNLRAATLVNQAVVLRKLNKKIEARENLDEAISLVSSNESIISFEETNEIKAKIYSVFAALESDENNYNKTIEYYQKALQLKTDKVEQLNLFEKRVAVNCYTGLGNIYFLKENVHESIANYQKALELTGEHESPMLKWPIYFGMGQSYSAIKKYDFALQELKKSAIEIEKIQDDLNTDEAKATFIESVYPVFQKFVEIAVHNVQSGAIDYAALAKILEQSKAQSLKDIVKHRKKLSVLIDEFEHPDRVVRNNNNSPIVAIDQPELSISLEKTKQRVLKLKPRLNELKLPDEQQHHRLIFHLLPEMTIGISVNANGNTKGFVFSKNRNNWDEDIDKFRRGIGTDLFDRDTLELPGTGDTPLAEQELNELLQKNYQELISPLAEHLPGEGNVLIIEPHEALWQIPFQLFQAPSGKFLCDAYQIILSPSNEIYQAIRQEEILPISTTSDPFLFAAYSEEVVMGNHKYVALRHAVEEVKTICNDIGISDDDQLLDDHFTKNEVLVKIPGSRIVHFATHGKLDAENPLNSSILLSGGANNADFLATGELRGMDLTSCEMVALSACKSGLGKIMGEGMVGLARVFLIAGARTLLVSLWSVEDKSSRYLMEKFYSNWRNNHNKAAALQAAIRSFRNDEEFKEFRHAKYWAPFVLIGVENGEWQRP